MAGRDIRGDVTVNTTAPEILELLARMVEADPKIPLVERKTLKQKLLELATNPHIIGLGTEALKAVLRSL